MLEIGRKYITNRSGPSIYLYGTPLIILVGGYIQSFILTYDVRLVMNEVNHLRGEHSIPRSLMRLIRIK